MRALFPVAPAIVMWICSMSRFLGYIGEGVGMGRTMCMLTLRCLWLLLLLLLLTRFCFAAAVLICLFRG